MAGRDPTRPQLEFPALVAELITQLRLTGQVGRLNFSDEVIPAFLIGSRGINFAGDLPAFTSAASFDGAISTPSANVVILDTGALPAGDYDILATMDLFGTIGAGATTMQLQHRDAGNVATLAVPLHLIVSTVLHGATIALPLVGYTIGLNERLRVISPSVAMTSGAVSASLLAQIRPTP